MLSIAIGRRAMIETDGEAKGAGRMRRSEAMTRETRSALVY